MHFITLAHLMISAGNCSLEAVISVSAKSHQNATVSMHVPYFSQSAAHTSCTLSLQGVLLCQAALCQPGTESPFMAAVLAGHECRCKSAQVGSTLARKLYPTRYGRAEDIMTASLSSRTQQVLVVDISELDIKLATAKQGRFGLVYNNTSGMA